MPRYEYWCSQCQKKQEIEKPMSRASENENCPNCKADLERIFTAPGITIKGSKVKFESACPGSESGCRGNCGHSGCDLE